MYVTASARAGWHALGERLGLYFMWCNRPFSRGQLQLTSPDVDIHPQVELGLLSDQRDVVRMMDMVRRISQLVITDVINANPQDLFAAAFTPRIKKLSTVSAANALMNHVIGTMLDVPAPIRNWVLKTFMLQGNSLPDILGNDNMLEEFVRRQVFGVWHASGTCRMGSPSDELAVVDSTGKVIGINNLYVSDASIMPRLPTANTNIPVIMIAEKISEGLLRESLQNGMRTVG
jgi:5-(hydroxymethyl)furfural/furfural oxidase